MSLTSEEIEDSDGETGRGIKREEIYKIQPQKTPRSIVQGSKNRTRQSGLKMSKPNFDIT